MVSEKLKVLSIDDDPTVQNVIRRTLGERFELLVQDCAESGIKIAKEVHPDIILMDVEMPKMNGYEACDILKTDPSTKDIPILFLSSLSDMRSRMVGFEVGAFDFLIKPFADKELIAKIDLIGAHKQVESKLKHQVHEASDTAYTAIKGSSELGLTIGFIEEIFPIQKEEELSRLMIKAFDGFDLSVSIMFLGQDGNNFYGSGDGDISPLEEEVMKTIYETNKRFTDFGCRTQINYPLVSVLVKNMPLHDMDLYGRYKDVIPCILEAASNKFQNIETEKSLAKQTEALSTALSAVQKNLGVVGGHLEKNQNNMVDLLKSVLADFEEKIPALGLEDDQEQYLLSKLDQTVNQAYKIIDDTRMSSASFSNISRLLENLVERQQIILASMKPKSTPKGDSSTVADGHDTNYGEVDLF